MKSLFWLGMLLAGLPLHPSARAAAILRGPTVEVSAASNAVVRWTTDVPTGSRVHFGAAPGALDRRADGDVAADHVVTLRDLRPGTRYYYTVGTARHPLATNQFATPGAASSVITTNRPAVTPSAAKAPPTGEIWGNLASLPDHFERHGGDFKARTPDDYARMAWEFLQRARTDGLPGKLDDDGVLRVFDPKSGAFAAYNRDGTAKTYFKPESRTYFERQPGRAINLKNTRWPVR